MTQHTGDSNGHHRKEHYFENRSPDEIQRELDATRREMANTIRAIEEDLSTRQLMMRAVDYLKGGPLRFTENLTDACVRNPIPVALIGAGLVMLSRADARERRGYVEYEGGETGEGLREKVSRTRERARSAMAQTKEKAHELKERAGAIKERASVVKERAHDLRVRSGERVRRSIDTAQRTWNENPMLVGIIAVAAGAALAATLPKTQREREVIGPRRDRLVGEAKRTAQTAVETAKRTAQTAVETAKQELESVKVEDERSLPDEPLTSDLQAEDRPIG
jgi:hypothetical protein